MMNLPVSKLLEDLRSDIAAANIVGNIEGLLARHIIGDDPRVEIAWSVDCDDSWVQSNYDPSSLPSVAALGYTIAHNPRVHYGTSLEDGLQRASTRDPNMAGHGAALHNPAVLIGLILGVRALTTSNRWYLTWCASVVSGLATAMSTSLDPLLAYAAQLAGVHVNQPRFDTSQPLAYCAALDWWCDRTKTQPFLNAAQRRILRETLVERGLAEGSVQSLAHQAALLWRAFRLAVAESSSLLLQSPSTVAQLLGQFESSLRRWRWDPLDSRLPVRWLIHREREVQDILWVVLRSAFPDLEDEDTLPKFGHSTYRADFGIPSLGLLIEVKFARSAADFKEIEKQLLQDIVPYLGSPERYKQVLVFIYDDSSSVQEHETTRRALVSVPGVADVLIVSRPSHLPSPDERAAWETAVTTAATERSRSSQNPQKGKEVQEGT